MNEIDIAGVRMTPEQARSVYQVLSRLFSGGVLVPMPGHDDPFGFCRFQVRAHDSKEVEPTPTVNDPLAQFTFRVKRPQE